MTNPTFKATAFSDANGNGVRDAGEAPLPGLEVALVAAGACTYCPSYVPPVPRKATAGSRGLTEAMELAPGVPHTVTAALPAGARFSPQDQGSDDTLDSDVDAQGVLGFTAPQASIVISDADGTRTVGAATPQIVTVDVGVVPGRLADTGRSGLLAQTILATALLVAGAAGIAVSRRRRNGLRG